MEEQPPPITAPTLGENTLRLLDSLNIGFLHLDMDFTILEVNEKVLAEYGGPREALVGHHCREFFSPEEFERLAKLDGAFLDRGAVHYQYEFNLPGKGGQPVPYLLNTSVNLDEAGAAISSNVLLTDISEQKRMQRELAETAAALTRSREELENEKRTLEAILFGIGDCVTVFDAAGRFLLGSPLGARLQSGVRAPMLGADAESEQVFRFDVDGAERFFTGRVRAIHDGQGRVIARAEILTEITDQVRLEQRENEMRHMQRQIERIEMGSEIVGPSPVMQRLFDRLLRCAEVEAPVVLLGETGAGKEVAARSVHARSKRAQRPFVAVNCGSIPESLLESELFGHEKGAFTGAVSSRTGLLREADGGTLFLDEVGDLDPAFQVKLLRALQEKEVRPLGSSRSYPIDVRIISATNKDLTDLVARGSFRSDLYFRIAVIPVVIPPLRDRREDVLPLADHFLRKHAGRGAAVKRLDPDAQRLLLQHTWPGNVRELANAIEYAVAMSRRSVLQADDFPLVQAARRETPDDARPQPLVPVAALASAGYLKPWELEERQSIVDALARCRGSRERAARELGMSRSTLWRKMRTYQV